MQKRNIASNLILFLFVILVSLAALLSDIFQNPIKTGSQIIEQAKLFSANDLNLTKRMTLKNKSGEYVFERIQEAQSTSWHMIAPRELSANSLFIEKLFNALTNIKVKKIFPDEKINNSNFSIDKPTSTLELIDQNNKTINIQFGLMNTIDNSTYLKISGRNGIYHAEAPNASLENATIIDLVESRVFSLNLETIQSFKIFHGINKTNAALIELKKKNGNWYDLEDKILSQDNIFEYFQEFANLKSSFVLDKPNETQKSQISKIPKNSQYIVSIEDNNGHSSDYNIFGTIKELNDLDFKNEEYWIVTISDNSISYIIKKEFIEILNRKPDFLKSNRLKK